MTLKHARRGDQAVRALPFSRGPVSRAGGWMPASHGSTDLLARLEELRRRLIVSLTAVGVGFVVALVFVERLVAVILVPLQQMLPPGDRLIYTVPGEAFLLHLRIAALAGILLAAPIVLWQAWCLLAPALPARERRLAIPVVLFATLLFVGGAAFSHVIAFPAAWRFFVSFSTEFMGFLPRVEPVFSLYAGMLVAFGLVFQMPLLALLLARAGIVTATWLVRHAKYAVLVIFVVAAVVTPTTDPVGQTLMAAPMVALYAVSILVASVFGRGSRGR